MAKNESENDPVEEADKPKEDASEESSRKVAGNEPESNEVSENDPDHLRGRLEEAYGKNAELQNNYLRKAADLDNFRKRLAREREEISSNAVTGLLEDLLPALDAFRLGLEATHDQEAGQEIIKGFAMALEQMNDICV